MKEKLLKTLLGDEFAGRAAILRPVRFRRVDFGFQLDSFVYI
jgi:hypothetical protein